MGIMIKAYNYIIDHWIINLIFSTVPAIWFIIIQTVGKQLNLVESDGSISGLSLGLFWIFVIFSIIFNALKSWGDSYNNKKIKDGQLLLRGIISSINSVCSKKTEYVKQHIKKDLKQENPLWITEQPRLQIPNLLEELNICLSNVTGIKRENIGLSIICKHDYQNQWQCYGAKNVSVGQLSEITDNQSSTARQIIDGLADTVFWPDKRQAEKVNQYIPSKKDKTNNMIGSIICANTGTIFDEHKHIKSVLSITTYGEQICTDKDEDTKKKLLNVVLQPFIIRINRELCLDYVISGLVVCNKELSKNDKNII